MDKDTATVIEPEILDEQGRPLALRAAAEKETGARSGARAEAAEHAASGRAASIHIYHRAGFLAGFIALAFTCMMMLLGALVTIFVVAPLLLLGRLIGLQVKSLQK